MSDIPAPIAPQPVRVTLTIEADLVPTGIAGLRAAGPIDNPGLCDALLLAAHDTIRDHVMRRAAATAVQVAGAGQLNALDAQRPRPALVGG